MNWFEPEGSKIKIFSVQLHLIISFHIWFNFDQVKNFLKTFWSTLNRILQVSTFDNKKNVVRFVIWYGIFIYRFSQFLVVNLWNKLDTFFLNLEN
jgi:hypothetical protein